MAVCCIENACLIYCNCKFCSTFEIQGGFLVFLLIDEQRNVLYVEFESVENTCSFPIDNSTRQLHVNFVYISLSVVKCNVCS